MVVIFSVLEVKFYFFLDFAFLDFLESHLGFLDAKFSVKILSMTFPFVNFVFFCLMHFNDELLFLLDIFLNHPQNIVFVMEVS